MADIPTDIPTATPISPGYPVSPTREPSRRSSFGGCVTFGAVVLLGLSALLNIVLLGARAGGGVESPGAASVHEKTVTGEGDAKVALISIDGIISDKGGGGGLFGGAPGEGLVKRIKDQLEHAKGDEATKAVLLDIDSPGGTVTASDQIWNALVHFREESKKPIVVHQGSLAASGGYYISAAGDEIICEPTTITGSIGVILEGLNFSQLLNDHGVKDTSITSGPNKALGSPTIPVQPDHQKILQETVDDMYGRFCHVVAEGISHRTGRSVADVLPEVKKLADGRIYTAQQAIDLKLADKIGYLEDAFNEAKAKAGVEKAKLIKYTRAPTFLEVLSGNAETEMHFGRGVSVKLDPALLDELRGPRLLMLWQGE
jgi:protease-4